jgi:hypothetical protein
MHPTLSAHVELDQELDQPRLDRRVVGGASDQRIELTDCVNDRPTCAHVAWLNARGLANRFSTLNVAKPTVTASLPRKRAAPRIVLSRDAGPAPGPRNGSHVSLAPRSVSHCDRPAGPGHPTTPNPKPHLTSNRSRDEIVSAVSRTSTTPTRPGREQAWDRAMNGDREPLSDLAQNAERGLPGDRQAMALLVGGLPDSQEIGMSRSRSCHPRGCDSVFKVFCHPHLSASLRPSDWWRRLWRTWQAFERKIEWLRVNFGRRQSRSGEGA